MDRLIYDSKGHIPNLGPLGPLLHVENLLVAKMCHQNCQGRQFADQEIAWLKSPIGTAQVGSSLTKPLPRPKSAINSAKVGSFLK